MSEQPLGTDFDLDEDLFGFDSPEEISDPVDDEEDLEAIFAAFQEEEELEKRERERQVSAQAPRPEVEPTTGLDAARAEQPSLSSAASPAAGAPTGAAPAPGAPAGSPHPVFALPGLSKGLLLILASVLSLNGLMAFVALRNSSNAKNDLLDVQRVVTESVQSLNAAQAADAAKEADILRPVVPPDIESHPVFEESIRDIEAGDYGEARQRIYAFLSVIDRLEDSERRKAEAKAQFLLARATHLEALQRLREEK